MCVRTAYNVVLLAAKPTKQGARSRISKASASSCHSPLRYPWMESPQTTRGTVPMRGSPFAVEIAWPATDNAAGPIWVRYKSWPRHRQVAGKLSCGRPYQASLEKLLIRLQARRWSTCGHVFECPSTSVGNSDPADIDQLGTSVDDLMSYRYQPSLSQKENHPICETEACIEVRFGAALLIDEQL
jgi:hypothetical protein